MYYTVYKIKNNINGKVYIGKHQTKNLDDGYMGSGKLLKRAIEKYGVQNFTKEILHVFDNEDDMNKKEKELVIVSEETYNLCEGGKGGFGYINETRSSEDRSNSIKLKYKRNPEIKDKIKRSNLNKCPSVNNRKINSIRLSKWNKLNENPMRNKTHKKSTLKIMSDKKLGSKNPSYGTCWICNENEVKKIPLENLEIWLDRGYIRGRKCTQTKG